jgi:hypothetical protein
LTYNDFRIVTCIGKPLFQICSSCLGVSKYHGADSLIILVKFLYEFDFIVVGI